MKGCLPWCSTSNLSCQLHQQDAFTNAVLKDLANTPDYLDTMDNVEVLMRMVVQ